MRVPPKPWGHQCGPAGPGSEARGGKVLSVQVGSSCRRAAGSPTARATARGSPAPQASKGLLHTVFALG